MMVKLYHRSGNPLSLHGEWIPNEGGVKSRCSAPLPGLRDARKRGRKGKREVKS